MTILEQMVFDILETADQAEQERADAHRDRTDKFFKQLAEPQRAELAALFAASEWLTCQALSAACGDYGASHGQ